MKVVGIVAALVLVCFLSAGCLPALEAAYYGLVAGEVYQGSKETEQGDAGMRISGCSSAAVWKAAKAVCKEMGISVKKTQELDKDHQGIITGNTAEHKLIEVRVKPITSNSTKLDVWARRGGLGKVALVSTDADQAYAQLISKKVKKQLEAW